MLRAVFANLIFLILAAEDLCHLSLPLAALLLVLVLQLGAGVPHPTGLLLGLLSVPPALLWERHHQPSLGSGDLLLWALLAGEYGLLHSLCSLFYGSLLCLLGFVLVFLRKKGKKALPFLPFLLLGHWLTLLSGAASVR